MKFTLAVDEPVGVIAELAHDGDGVRGGVRGGLGARVADLEEAVGDAAP